MKIKNYDCHQRRIFRMVRNIDISTQISITTIKDSHSSGKKTLVLTVRLPFALYRFCTDEANSESVVSFLVETLVLPIRFSWCLPCISLQPYSVLTQGSQELIVSLRLAKHIGSSSISPCAVVQLSLCHIFC